MRIALPFGGLCVNVMLHWDTLQLLEQPVHLPKSNTVYKYLEFKKSHLLSETSLHSVSATHYIEMSDFICIYFVVMYRQ